MDNKAGVRIAVIKTDGIGDAILASPFLFELRKNFKDAHITGILSPLGSQAIGNLPVFDEVKVIDPKWLKYKKTFFLSRWASAFGLLNLVNKGRYDMVIGLRWQDRLTSLVLSLCNAKEKYGYDVRGMGFGIKHKIVPAPANMHVIDRNLRVLPALKPGVKYGVKLGFSVDIDSEDKVKGITGKIKNYIVIHPVSGHVSKDWNIEKYKELAQRLAKKHPVFVIGAAADSRINEITGKNIRNMAGSLNVRETGALIRRAALVIGNDSAAVHIASVFGVKSLTVFSGTAAHEVWGAYGKNSYIMAKNPECRVCGLVECNKDSHECMDFSVDEVEELAYRIIYGKQKKRLFMFNH